MLIARMVDNKIEDQFHSAFVEFVFQHVNILDRAILGVDLVIIANVIALIYVSSVRENSSIPPRYVLDKRMCGYGIPHHVNLRALKDR